MWTMFAYFIAAVVVFSLLMPKPQTENARPGKLGDLTFPRAKEGDPVALVWGTVRLRSPNTIWYGDFKAIPIQQKVKTGMFSSKKVTVGYKYYLGMDLALCLGPGVSLLRFWAGKDLVWSGTLSSESDLTIDRPNLFGGEERGGGLQGTMTFYPGSFSQSRDPYLAARCDPNVPRYGGICHLVFKNFYIGTQLSLRSFNFEVQRLTNSLGSPYAVMPNGKDVNPMEILYDCLTGDWGRLGIDTALIDTASWTAAAETLYNEGNGMSIAVQAANDGPP